MVLKYDKTDQYSETSYLTRYFKRNNKTLNVIGIPYIDIWTFIVESFDLNICKVAYYKGKIKIFDIESLELRVCHSNPSTLLTLTFYERIDLNRDDAINLILSKQRSRVMKYISYGFTIFIHPKNNEIIKTNMRIYEKIKDRIESEINQQKFLTRYDFDKEQNKRILKQICFYYELRNIEKQI